MSGWDDGGDDDDDIMVGKRRRRAKRRMDERRPGAWIGGTLAVVVLIGLGVAAYIWLNRPTGLATLPDPAVAAGTYRTQLAEDNSAMTVVLEVRNASEETLTVVAARIVPPPGLTAQALSLGPTGPENEGFQLDNELPAPTAVRLEPNQSAVLAARYTIDCKALPKANEPPDEQIYVTVRIEEEQREDELVPPAWGELPWLTATAERACKDPLTTATPEPPAGPSD